MDMWWLLVQQDNGTMMMMMMMYDLRTLTKLVGPVEPVTGFESWPSWAAVL